MATQPKEATPVSAEPEAELAQAMDRLSLDQALIDFEVANARVVDLTQRLIAAGEEVAALRREVEVLRAERREQQRHMEALSNSRALRLAAAARGLVRAVRR